MSVDKGPYQAPQGISTLVENESNAPSIEVVLVGEGEIDIAELEEAAKEEFAENIAEKLSEGALQKIANDLIVCIKEDLQARKDWEKMYKDGVQLLGLKIEDRTEPWAGACGVYHPMITEAVVRFQADTIMETFPAAGPARTKILGKQTQEKEDAAARVEEDLNWQLTENMAEFRPEHEKMLFNLPSAGSAFKKVYDDTALGRQTSVFVPAEDIILPYGMTDMITCPRYTHRMLKTKQDVLRLQVNGFWRDVDLGEPPKANVMLNDIQGAKNKEVGITAINDNRYTVYEAYIDLDLYDYDEDSPDGDNDGVAIPYVVTIIEDGSDKVLSIRRNWKEDDPLKLKRQHVVHYQYIPGYGSYGFGLFHLIGGYAKSATGILRQLVDAGTLSNLPGGLKARGLRVKGDDTPISPGEFRDVDIGSGAIKDNIMMLPYKEPSQVLAGLLQSIIEEGKAFASSSGMKISDMSNQAPVGSTLALLERQLKVMSAVQARVHFSFKLELRLLAAIIKDYADEGHEYDYEVDAPLGRRAKKKDFSYVEIVPVSDPNAATMSQRVVQYQAVLQLSQSTPQIYDMPELHKQMLHVLGLKNIDKLIPSEDDLKPCDPVQENQNMMIMKPVKVFAEQDHASHLAVHVMAVEDPGIQERLAKNPQANAIGGAMASHIAEHVGYEYRNSMALAMGVRLPAYDKENTMPADVEKNLSRMMAAAAPQVLQKARQIAADKQARQNAQDPVLQAQLQEEMNQKAEIDRKAARDKEDIRIKDAELQLQRDKLLSEGKGPQAAQQQMQAAQQEQMQSQQAHEQQQFQGQQVHQQEQMQAQQQAARAVEQHEQEQRHLQQAHQVSMTSTADRHMSEQERTAEKARQELRHKREVHNASLKAQAAEAKKPKKEK